MPFFFIGSVAVILLGIFIHQLRRANRSLLADVCRILGLTIVIGGAFLGLLTSRLVIATIFVGILWVYVLLHLRARKKSSSRLLHKD